MSTKSQKLVHYKQVMSTKPRYHGITGKSMCLGIDIRQSKQEVFNI